MRSMPWGVLPTQAEFDAAFDEKVDGCRYKIRNCKRVVNWDATQGELWAEVCKATLEDSEGDDAAGQWASCVLYTLGFEWILWPRSR